MFNFWCDAGSCTTAESGIDKLLKNGDLRNKTGQYSQLQDAVPNSYLCILESVKWNPHTSELIVDLEVCGDSSRGPLSKPTLSKVLTPYREFQPVRFLQKRFTRSKIESRASESELRVGRLAEDELDESGSSSSWDMGFGPGGGFRDRPDLSPVSRFRELYEGTVIFKLEQELEKSRDRSAGTVQTGGYFFFEYGPGWTVLCLDGFLNVGLARSVGIGALDPNVVVSPRTVLEGAVAGRNREDNGDTGEFMLTVEPRSTISGGFGGIGFGAGSSGGSPVLAGGGQGGYSSGNVTMTEDEGNRTMNREDTNASRNASNTNVSAPEPDELVLPTGGFFRILEVSRLGLELRVICCVRGPVDEEVLAKAAQLLVYVAPKISPNSPKNNQNNYRNVDRDRSDSSLPVLGEGGFRPGGPFPKPAGDRPDLSIGKLNYGGADDNQRVVVHANDKSRAENIRDWAETASRELPDVSSNRYQRYPVKQLREHGIVDSVRIIHVLFEDTSGLETFSLDPIENFFLTFQGIAMNGFTKPIMIPLEPFLLISSAHHSSVNMGPERRDRDSCIICSQAAADATFVHGGTGHNVCCVPCAFRLMESSARCPICRKRVETVIQTFKQ